MANNSVFTRFVCSVTAFSFLISGSTTYALSPQPASVSVGIQDQVVDSAREELFEKKASRLNALGISSTNNDADQLSKIEKVLRDLLLKYEITLLDDQVETFVKYTRIESIIKDFHNALSEVNSAEDLIKFLVNVVNGKSEGIYTADVDKVILEIQRRIGEIARRYDWYALRYDDSKNSHRMNDFSGLSPVAKPFVKALVGQTLPDMRDESRDFISQFVASYIKADIANKELAAYLLADKIASRTQTLTASGAPADYAVHFARAWESAQSIIEGLRTLAANFGQGANPSPSSVSLENNPAVSKDDFDTKRSQAIASLSNHELITTISSTGLTQTDAEARNISDLSIVETRSLWASAENIKEYDRIEIIYPQTLSLTGTMNKVLDELKAKHGNDSIKCRSYSDEDNLSNMLSPASGVSVKRIIITATGIGGIDSTEAVGKLAKSNPALFKGVRLYSIAVPDGYDKLEDRQKNFFQARLIMEAILLRQYKGKDDSISGLILSSLLRNRVENVEVFLSGLVEEEGEEGQSISNRIIACLDRIVSFTKMINEDIERARLIMREFWTAA